MRTVLHLIQTGVPMGYPGVDTAARPEHHDPDRAQVRWGGDTHPSNFAYVALNHKECAYNALNHKECMRSILLKLLRNFVVYTYMQSVLII